MKTVTAIIPCYNAAPYLAEAIASVRAQTRAPDELLVVDDCSMDGSAEIAEALGVRVLRMPENKGVSAARNMGLAEARGELVAWLDADDYWEPEHLATVVPLLEQHEDAVLAFGLVRAFGAREWEWSARLPAHESVDALEECVRSCILPQTTLVVRREAVRGLGGYDESMRLAEDFDLFLRLSRHHRFVCTHEITAKKREHESNISGGDPRSYATGEYRSRHRFLLACREEEPQSYVARVEAAILGYWEEHLRLAWIGRSAGDLQYHLSMREYVPYSEEVRTRWSRRAHLLPMARIGDRLQRVRGALIRRLKQRTGGAAGV